MEYLPWIIFAVVVVVTVWAFMTYNGLIQMRARINNAWAQIDVQLRRRYDLIPNLVETVKGYMAHEREVLENVTRARSSWAEAKTVEEQAGATGLLTGALKTLFAVAENYPDLKANQNFLALQEELTGTENKISFARQFYNDEVMRFNARIQTVPTRLIADMFDFAKRPYFHIEEAAARAPVTVSFARETPERASPPAAPEQPPRAGE